MVPLVKVTVAVRSDALLLLVLRAPLTGTRRLPGTVPYPRAPEPGSEPPYRAPRAPTGGRRPVARRHQSPEERSHDGPYTDPTQDGRRRGRGLPTDRRVVDPVTTTITVVTTGGYPSAEGTITTSTVVSSSSPPTVPARHRLDSSSQSEGDRRRGKANGGWGPEGSGEDRRKENPVGEGNED